MNFKRVSSFLGKQEKIMDGKIDYPSGSWVDTPEGPGKVVETRGHEIYVDLFDTEDTVSFDLLEITPIQQ